MTRQGSARRRVWLGVIFFALFVGGFVSTLVDTATAQPAGDDAFALASDEWNGLSSFQRLAGEHGVDLQPARTLDYDALTPGRALILVHPDRALDAGSLQDFVSDGGRILLFDDFGRSDALLSQFSDPIRRVAPVPPEVATDLLNGNPNLPVLATPGRHALLEGEVDFVAGNHPAGFLSTLPAVVYYADGELGFAYDLTIGSGKMIVVGDSSLVINLMLPIADNEAFVGNALDYLCQGQPAPCEATLLVGDFGASGVYGEPDASRPELALQGGLEKLNEMARKLDRFVPERRLMRVMTVLLTLGLVLFGLTVFPFRAPRFLDIRFRPPSPLLPESEFERNLREFSRPNANYALPMAILRDEFEHSFLHAVYPSDDGPPDTEKRYRGSVIAETAERYAARVSQAPGGPEWRRRQRQAERVMRQFARIPARSQIFIDPGRRYSERDLVQLHAECLDMLEALGVREEYEQRTRRTG